jgi:hypothetical protein
MGVYSEVRICVRGDGPLDAATRVSVITLCRKHELLSGECAIATREAPSAAPTPSWWARVKRVFAAGDPPRADPLVTRGLSPHSVAGRRPVTNLCVLQDGPCGPWVEQRATELGTDFVINTANLQWRGETREGAFSYLAASTPVKVHVFDRYRDRRKNRNPHVPDDGSVGAFWDVMTLYGKAQMDGRELSSSAFVREMRNELELKVMCRASYY